MFCKADTGNWPWTDQRLLGHPKFQRTERADPNVHRLFPISVSGSPVVHAVSLGMARHIAGNMLHELFYVVLADRGTVKGRVQDLWPGTVEAYRLDTATI